MTPEPALRLLVACSRCERQYDATGWQPGHHFPCSCGHEITVPAASAHEAAVVRCSSCGAPRQGGAAACRFCDADFTLHEQDLDTLCPGCLARISRRARYCHACATPIVVEEKAAARTAHACPACHQSRAGERPTLVSRRLGDLELSFLECEGCAGLWVGRETFEHLLDRIRRGERTMPGIIAPVTRRQREQVLYRRCPYCSKLMHRKNFGQHSGIILDVCSRHGLWFDPHELPAVLDWVKKGGLHAERERRSIADTEARERRVDYGKVMEVGRTAGSRPSYSPIDSGDYILGLGEMVGSMIELAAAIFD